MARSIADEVNALAAARGFKVFFKTDDDVFAFIGLDKDKSGRRPIPTPRRKNIGADNDDNDDSWQYDESNPFSDSRYEFDDSEGQWNPFIQRMVPPKPSFRPQEPAQAPGRDVPLTVARSRTEEAPDLPTIPEEARDDISVAAAASKTIRNTVVGVALTLLSVYGLFRQIVDPTQDGRENYEDTMPNNMFLTQTRPVPSSTIPIDFRAPEPEPEYGLGKWLSHELFDPNVMNQRTMMSKIGGKHGQTTKTSKSVTSCSGYAFK